MSSRPLTVLYSFAHILGASGIGVTALEQVRGLHALGHRCIVYCSSAALRVPGIETIETLVVARTRIPHRAFGVERAWRLHDRRVARALRQRAEEIDIVHGWPQSSLHTFRAASAAGIPSFREAPNTHTAHAYDRIERVNVDAGVTPPTSHSHTRNPRRLAREFAEYDAADRILVPSEHSASTFVAQGVPPSRLARHRYGCDLSRFHPPNTSRSEEAPPVFLFVGRAEPRKGLHVLLDVWRDATAGTGSRLVIVGTFVPGFRERLQHKLDDPTIEHVPFTNRVADLMRSADVLVLPSFEEGSALVTYEAQATGCVLAVSDATGALCEPGVHGLLHPAGDVPALRDDLQRLAHEPQLRATLRANVLADRERLSWRNAAEALAAHYCHESGAASVVTGR